jgi:hypothetical protein
VDPSQDYRWLLSDRQINAQNDEEFVHEVRQPLTAAGIQYASRVLINYDPVCQSLTFHWARLWRGTNKLDRLDPARMRVNEAGRDAKEWLFGSAKTALLPLDDVRVGDIVDYAYSIEGKNPALGGKFCDAALPHQPPDEHPADDFAQDQRRRIHVGRAPGAGIALGTDDACLVRPLPMGAVERVPEVVGYQPLGVAPVHDNQRAVAGVGAEDQPMEAIAGPGGPCDGGLAPGAGGDSLSGGGRQFDRL